jgi:hypothetical protein
MPNAPASSVAVDPQNANTIYVATDQGVYFSSNLQNCTQILSNCWSEFGVGLPGAPAVALSASSSGASPQVLAAATYGRGIWETPLWTAGTVLATAAASPASLSFPSQASGTASSPLTVTLENTGSLALTPSSISIAGDFSETDHCVNASVAAGASCTIQVTFTPQATGPESGEMTIYADVYGGQLTVDLNGTGTPAGAVSVTPGTVGFGQVEVGATSPALQVTIANSSVSPVPISSVSITSPFVLAGNSCGTTSLSASTDCQMQVEFAPTTAGIATGLLTITDGAGTQSVELNGTGAAPATDNLSSSSLAFAATGEGQLSAAQSVTITNTGGLPLTSIAISATSGFQQSSTCVTQLAAGDVCTISVVFAPTQLGAITGTLTIADALRTQTVALSGTALVPPGLSVSPSSLTFANQRPGVASAPQTLTVSNAGGMAIANIAFQITGTAASSYAITASTCGAVLNQGSSCALQVVLDPAGYGSAAATLAVSTSTLGVGTISVPLNGAGFDFAVVVSGAPSETVASGQLANYTLVLAPNGSSGTFSFACGTLPANASCVFNPTTETLGSGVQGNVLVEISTASGTTARLDEPGPGKPGVDQAGSGHTGFWRTLPLACGLFLLPLALWKRRRVFWLAVLAVFLAGSVTSCTTSGGGSTGGGGSSGSGGSGSTSTGTYTIPVIVTSIGVAHTVNLTLTVD